MCDNCTRLQKDYEKLQADNARLQEERDAYERSAELAEGENDRLRDALKRVEASFGRLQAKAAALMGR